MIGRKPAQFHLVGKDVRVAIPAVLLPGTRMKPALPAASAQFGHGGILPERIGMRSPDCLRLMGVFNVTGYLDR